MKNYLKLIMGAIFIGALFAFLFYQDLKKEVNALNIDANTLYLFQVGVFSSIDNAQNFANDFASHIVYNDNEYNRVIICLTSSKENKNKLKDLYEKKNINFYLKKIKGDQEFLKSITKQEELLKKMQEEKAINKICQNLLDEFLKRK